MWPIRVFTLLSCIVAVVAAVPVKNWTEIRYRMSNSYSLANDENMIKQDSGIRVKRNRKVGEISRKKCEEYGREIVWMLPLTESRPIPISLNCPIPLMNPLISGGEAAQTGEFRHMVAIGWKSRDRRTIVYHCGGSLVSDVWVLTTAHCTHSTMGKPSYVRLGTDRLTNQTSGRLLKIEVIKKHPGYVPPRRYADIALLKLSTAVKLSPDIKPACLDTEFGKAPAQAWVTGWGSTELNGEPSDILLKAKLEIVDNVRCSLAINATSSVPNGVVPSMLCAGDPTGGWKKDTCKGDSGGPLQTLHPNGCVYNIIGITSFGRLCATPNNPGVYTRVSHYLEWIESIIWPEDT